MKSSSGTRILSRCVFIMGVAALSYLTGAAVIFFGLPSADFLERALIGSRVWIDRRKAPLPNGEFGSFTPAARSAVPTVDDPSKTFDGFTLYACADNEGEGVEAFLIDMRGELVHQWSVPKWQIRLYQPALTEEATPVHNFKPSFFGCRLGPSGDLFVVLHGGAPVGGYGLLKLDKDSNILWEYPFPVHHDIDVGPDGTIYAIQGELLAEMPRELEHIATPCQGDQVVLLSPDGVPLREPVSILEAIRNSPYAMLLSPLGKTRETRTRELLHSNFIQVLRPALASKFPAFKAGQVLISMRHLDAIAVIDLDAGRVVWAATGPWRAQHAPQFLDNGRLLIFDNRGGLNGSRVLEYDPQSQAFPWWYPGTRGRPFYTSERGMSQRLPNGNTLVVDSEGGEIVEVSPEGQIVWTYTTGRFVTTGRRYGADELPFLGDRVPRP